MQPLACDLWLIDPVALRQMVSGSVVVPDPEQARAAAQSAPRQQKTVAVIPVHGAIEARPSFIGELLGMPSYERLGVVLDMVMADDSVSHVIFDHASPGGMVYGAPELADKIYKARGRKPIISVANPMAASGSYWIAAAADRVVVTPSGDVGSVGVIVEHVDFSQALEKFGQKVTVLTSKSAPYKGEWSGVTPLSDEARANAQARADRIHNRFVSDLAKFRGVSVEHVNERFGQGRVVDAQAALAAGMVDRIGTLQDVIVGAASGRIRIRSERAEDEWDAPTRRDVLRERVAAIQAATEMKTIDNQ